MRRFPQTMRRLLILATALAVLGGVACEARDDEEPTLPQDPALERARTVARLLAERLTSALTEQIEQGTPAEAITVCSQIAPLAAEELSRDGVEIRRISARHRNPGNAPDHWEMAQLERLEELHAAGELPQELYERQDAAGEMRYLRPIVVAPACLQCHGAEGDLAATVRAGLAELYPEDRATGYAAGDLRGAFSVSVR